MLTDHALPKNMVTLKKGMQKPTRNIAKRRIKYCLFIYLERYVFLILRATRKRGINILPVLHAFT